MEKRRMERKVYSNMKLLCDSTDLTDNQIAEIFKCSPSHVGRVRKSSGYEGMYGFKEKQESKQVSEPETPQNLIASYAQVKGIAQDVNGIKCSIELSQQTEALMLEEIMESNRLKQEGNELMRQLLAEWRKP